MRWCGRLMQEAAPARAARAIVWLALLAALLPVAPARAVPAFAREMGVPCSTCHTLAYGPALTAFGRNFKLHGYSLGSQKTIPVSADLIASYTHTETDQPAVPHYSTNNNLAFDGASIYVGGRIADHFGAFLQVGYDGIARHTQWGFLDARYAQDFTIAGTSVLFGVSVNNSPTIQDPWNSTSAWQFPFPGARLTNGPNAAPQINGFFATQALGTTAYAMIDDMVYLEAGGYRKFSDRLQADFGVQNPQQEHGIDGTAPYLRAALQRSMGAHYASIGVIDFAPHAQFPSERTIGSDNYTDTGLDATYQFADGGPHTFNAYASYIHEEQRLFGLFGASSLADNHVNQLNVSGQYAYQQTYSLTVAYFQDSGNVNHALYAPGAFYGSANGSPDSNGYILQLECIPFGKIDSIARPFLNMRVGLQYTGYTRFNGGDSNYDGAGHSARDNNTLFLFFWMII